MSEPMTWTIASGPEAVEPVRDHTRLRYVLGRDGDERDVFVEVSGTACASDPAALPSPLDEVVASHGRSEVERHLKRHEPPSRIIVTTGGVTVVPRDGYYAPNDRVFVLRGGRWDEARVVEPGEPSDAISVKHEGVVGGEYKSDVVFIRPVDGNAVEPHRYEHVRPTPPRSAP